MMSWTAPMTATDGGTLSAVEYNVHVRDNLLETAPAKATTANAGALFVSVGGYAIAERRITQAEVLTSQTRAATTYGDLSTVGPSVTVTTGTRAAVWTHSFLTNNNSIWSSYASHQVSGATNISASDEFAFRRQGTNNLQGSSMTFHVNLTPGSHTFTMKYRVAGGTGTFQNRRIIVWPM